MAGCRRSYRPDADTVLGCTVDSFPSRTIGRSGFTLQLVIEKTLATGVPLEMYAYNAVMSVTCICVVGMFAGGPQVRLDFFGEIQKKQIPDHKNVVCHVGVLFLSCNFDLLANWRMKKYKFIMTTLIGKTK